MLKRAILALTVLLAATPAFAAEEKAVFGHATCGSTVSCSQFSGYSSDSPAFASLVATAESCVANRLGFHGDHAFEASYGLDSNRCLHANTVGKAKQGYTISPTCCLVQVGDDTCRLACKMIGEK
jgi:hypothetical protein